MATTFCLSTAAMLWQTTFAAGNIASCNRIDRLASDLCCVVCVLAKHVMAGIMSAYYLLQMFGPQYWCWCCPLCDFNAQLTCQCFDCDGFATSRRSCKGPREHWVCKRAKHVDRSSAEAADICKTAPDSNSNPGP